MTTDPAPSKGDEYRHPDGTVEIVFAIEDDRLLTVKEYRRPQFSEAVADASYQGIDEDIATLPPVDFYREMGPDGSRSDTER